MKATFLTAPSLVRATTLMVLAGALGTPPQTLHAAPSPDRPGISLPALGDSASQTLSPMAERRLGDRIMRSILQDPAIIDDPLLQEYIQALWSDLLDSARQRGEIGADLDGSHAWRPFLVRDRSVNAFALPGGYIGVHLGLIAATDTPDELASVLAHELAHVTQRHIARMIGDQKRTSWVSIASMLLGALAASSNPQAAQALIVGGQAANIQGRLNFSRDMEREADRVGFGILTDADFAPAGMAQMFELLQRASRLMDDNSYPYLRTHPLTTDRIGEARSRLGLSDWSKVPPPPDSAPGAALLAQHALLAARARVLADTRSISLQPLSRVLPRPAATPLDVVATHYQVALALNGLNERKGALAALAQARRAMAELPLAQQTVIDRLLALQEAATLVEGRQAQEAATVLDRLLKENGSSTLGASATRRPELLLATRIALNQGHGVERLGHLEGLAALLQTQVARQPLDAAAWSALAQVWQRLKQPLRALRAEAEAVAALGDLPGAIDRLESARRSVKGRVSDADAIELTVIQSRTLAWQRQQRADAQADQ